MLEQYSITYRYKLSTLSRKFCNYYLQLFFCAIYWKVETFKTEETFYFLRHNLLIQQFSKV